MLVRNSGNATSRQRSKGLNINCAELFSPPVLLPGTASQVQGSRRSPVECSVSITGMCRSVDARSGWPASPIMICDPSFIDNKLITQKPLDLALTNMRPTIGRDNPGGALEV
eukprot:superscaffoldBa00001067_g8787